MSDKETEVPRTLRTRTDAGEIDLLDQENALLEIEDIIDRVRTMAAVSYGNDDCRCLADRRILDRASR